MAKFTEHIYNGRDNTIDLLLKADGSAVDLSSITRMVLYDVAGGWTVDSDESSGSFDWTTGTTGKVIIDAGGAGITAGDYWVKLRVYDATNTNGIVWGEAKPPVESDVKDRLDGPDSPG